MGDAAAAIINWACPKLMTIEVAGTTEMLEKRKRRTEMPWTVRTMMTASLETILGWGKKSESTPS